MSSGDGPTRRRRPSEAYRIARRAASSRRRRPEGLWSAAIVGGFYRRAATLGDVRPLRLDVHRIERLARGHEEPVALRPSEADVRADLGELDLPDALAVRREDVDAVVAGARPSRGR